MTDLRCYLIKLVTLALGTLKFKSLFSEIATIDIFVAANKIVTLYNQKPSSALSDLSLRDGLVLIYNQYCILYSSGWCSNVTYVFLFNREVEVINNMDGLEHRMQIAATNIYTALCFRSPPHYRSVLSKWEFFIKMRAAFLLSLSSITQGRMGASKAALILMKNSHFDRTLQ